MKHWRLVSALCLHAALTLFAAEPIKLTPVQNAVPSLKAGVLDPSHVSVVPTTIERTRPKYPAELRSAGLSGEATIFFVVKADGAVADALVIKANDTRFGDAALAAVRQWKFRPATVDGKPVNCRLMVPIQFVPPKKS